jgi:hypothetical protein
MTVKYGRRRPICDSGLGFLPSSPSIVSLDLSATTMSAQPSAGGTADAGGGDASSVAFGGALLANTPVMVFTIAAMPLIVYLLNKIIFPTVDPREPPVLRPKVPFIGHIVSLLSEKTRFFDRL